MTYERRLKRWIVVRLSDPIRPAIVARFIKFSDATGYQQALQRLDPNGRYEVMFEPEPLE
jgi:hypothetical protein